MKKLLFFIISVSIVSLLSCNNVDDEITSDEYVQIAMPSATRAVSFGQQMFAVNIFNQEINDEENNDKNIVLPSLATFNMLSWLANGYEGVAQEEILSLLGIDQDSQDIETLNQYNSILQNELPKLDKNVVLLQNCSLWSHGFQIFPDFNKLSTNFFNAEFKDAPTNNDIYIKDANTWISSKTQGMIKEFFPKGSILTNPLLISTTYFNGKWKNKFDKAKTSLGDFTTSRGVVNDVPFMKMNDKIVYSEENGWQAVHLSYGHNNYQMSVILPAHDSSIKNFDSYIYNGLIQNVELCNVSLSLPKFIVEYKGDIKTACNKFGVNKVFQKIDNKIFENQKIGWTTMPFAAKVVVDEDGTEASGVQAVSVVTANLPSKDVNITFDRPFIFVIREVSTSAILFIGQINNL